MDQADKTPAQLGYRWPAEWEPQASVWLAWPRNPDTWPGHFEPVPAEFAQFVRLLAEYEPVNILAGGQEVMQQAKSFVGQVKNVTLHDIPTNDAWCRDHGPTFLASGSRVQGPEGGRHNHNLNPEPRTPNPPPAPTPEPRAPALVDWE